MEELKNPEISSVLTVSTSHIRLTDAVTLDFAVGDGPIVVYKKGDLGWLLYAGDSYWLAGHNTHFSPELEQLCRDAISNGCDWLMLDRDGSVYDNRPAFNW